MERLMRGRVVVPGQAEGVALVSSEPLSFWGGYDYHTGEIIDRRHPLSGQIAAGRDPGLPFHARLFDDDRRVCWRPSRPAPRRPPS